MKTICIFITLFALPFVNIYGQVTTNFNNPKKFSSKGYFQKDHKNFYLVVAPPDTSEIISSESYEKNEKTK